MSAPLGLEEVKNALDRFGTVEQVRSNRIKVKTVPEKVRDALFRAQALLSCDHLIQISALDNGRGFELIYHLTGPHRTVLAIAVELPREKPEMPTTSDILPPAGIYERQIYDLFGIVFTGHPNLKRIILNEDWPKDEFPMRKDWKPKPRAPSGGVRGGAR
jgi:NADH:ubiquinone oxidoreductase subunit C